MKALSARLLVLGLACLLCAGPLARAGGPPGRVGARELEVETAAEHTANGQVELLVSWHWRSPAARWRWKVREELLAVSFDTRGLVVEYEEAPLGRGANGEALRRLEQVAGADGARRLFVIPEGEDGYVRVRFRTAYSGATPAGGPFRVYVVFDPPTDPVWTKVLPLRTGSESIS